MALTTKSVLPAAELDVLPDDADAVFVNAGSPAEPTTVLVAGRDHFRVLDEHRSVLYRRGEHIPPEHAAAPSVDAELQDNGTHAPRGRKRAPVEPPARDTGQATAPPSTVVRDSASA